MSAQTRRDRDFTAYVEASSVALRRYCLMLTGSRAQADDLLQDALVKVYLAWNRITEPEAIDGYTRTVILRTHLSWWRSRARRDIPVEEPVSTDTTRAGFDEAIAQQDEMWRLLARVHSRESRCRPTGRVSGNWRPAPGAPPAR